MPSIYFAHDRDVFARDGMICAPSPFVGLMDGEGRADDRVSEASMEDRKRQGYS